VGSHWNACEFVGLTFSKSNALAAMSKIFNFANSLCGWNSSQHSGGVSVFCRCSSHLTGEKSMAG